MRLILMTAVITGLAAPAALAQPLYGADAFSGDLIRIDPTSGSSTLVGAMGVGNPIGLAFNAASGTLFTRTRDALYTVDPSDGSTELVGPSGAGLTALAFDTSFDRLFSAGGDGLYRVDQISGAATLVGATGVDIIDLSTSPSNVLWAATLFGDLYTIDMDTGTAAFQFNAGINVTSIQFQDPDTLLAVTLEDDNFYSIDLGTQMSTLIGGPLIRQDVRGMAFIPAPGAMMVLAVGGLAAVRRRRT